MNLSENAILHMVSFDEHSKFKTQKSPLFSLKLVDMLARHSQKIYCCFKFKM